MSLVSCIANSMDTSSASKHNVWPVQIQYRDVPWPLIASVLSEPVLAICRNQVFSPSSLSCSLSFFSPIFKTCEFGFWLEQVELGFRIRSPVTQNVNCLPGHCTVSPKAGSSLKDRLTFKGTFVGEYVSFRSSWIHQVWLIYQYATSKAYLKHIFSTGVITLH